MPSHARKAFALMLTSLILIMGACAVLVLMVPGIRSSAKARWHAYRCPPVPAERSVIGPGAVGHYQYIDPAPFSGAHDDGPNLFFDFGPGVNDLLIGPGDSPAIVRSVHDVADSLISISAGFRLRSPIADPDLRITIRIDRADGQLVEWNEKRLRPDEHLPDQWEILHFEWLLRDLPVDPNDRISVFVRNLGQEEVHIDDLKIVYRSAAPLRPRST